MHTNKANMTNFKAQITILMVLLFCVLVSSSEYIIQSGSVEKKTEKSSNDSPKENSTFIHTAVDAVVPFVVVVLDQVFHLISEVIGLERQPSSRYKGLNTYSNQFFEVLFEHIVSTNAP